ncbi:MAG: flagellar motor protein MotA, partial [Pseudomonadota bacterium]|nr:flagellar motor protein MotA [Pseudomonadota bacterium]
MTRPTHVFIWMIPFLGLVGLTVILLYGPLSEAFLSNPVFNSIILAVLLVGILINFRQVGMLSAEVAWINHYRGKRKRFWQSRPDKPRLLAPLAKMLGQQESDFLSLSPLPLRAVLDSVRLRLDELRDVSRYMIGLLIFLGLLGTFWGLLITVSAVGNMIGDLGGSGAENAVMFGSLLEGLKAPLSGMGTAFSSSLFGLAGSLVLGFLDLQAGHAQTRFFNELEDWLTGVTRMTGAQMIGERELSEPSYIHAMLEQTAETLDKLQRNVMRDDAQRHLIGDQIHGLGRELAAFADLSRDEQRILSALAKGQTDLAPVLKLLAERQGSVDESMQEHVRNLDSNIKRLVDELVSGRERLVDEIRDELR